MAHEPIVYRLEHSTATVELALDGDRFHVGTCGVGLIDKPKIHAVATSDVSAFAIVPTIGAQNMVRRSAGESPYDTSYDAELLLVLRVDGSQVKRRMFVNSQHPEFRRLMAGLVERCPTASLLHLEPAAARKQMGFASPMTAVFVILFMLIGLPILIAIAALGYLAFTGFK